jgi:NitT/TauT family transport system substrate-binding protein
MDPDAWKQTVQVALNTQNGDGDTVITKEPDSDAYTTDYTEQALENLTGMGLDTTGADFQPIDVTLEEGGK